MKAALMYGVKQPLRVEKDYPTPRPGMKEVLVKVMASGICGTDLHIIDGEIQVKKLPIILGHEISGEVAEVGENVNEFSKGDRVLVVGGCGKCKYCLAGQDNLCETREVPGIDVDGGFAEYVKVPANNVMKVPDEISYEEAAISTDSLATPFHALQKLDVRLGQTVAVFGTGGLGMNLIQLAKLAGAKVIAIGRRDEKLRIAKELGAEEVINMAKVDPVKRVKELMNGEGVDVAFEVIGLKKTIEQTISCVRKGGKVGIIGGGPEAFCVPIRQLLWNDLSIVACFGALRSEFPVFLELVRTGKINLKRMITHRFPLDDINKALRTLRERIGNPIRIVVLPHA